VKKSGNTDSTIDPDKQLSVCKSTIAGAAIFNDGYLTFNSKGYSPRCSLDVQAGTTKTTHIGLSRYVWAKLGAPTIITKPKKKTITVLRRGTTYYYSVPRYHGGSSELTEDGILEGRRWAVHR